MFPTTYQWVHAWHQSYNQNVDGVTDAIAQLMAVLPADSSHCLPPKCRELMVDPASPVLDFYPDALAFPLDPNGIPAAIRWLWVAKLPFIDPARLLRAVKEASSSFTPEERERNSTSGTAELMISRSRHKAGAAAVAAATSAVFAECTLLCETGAHGSVAALASGDTRTPRGAECVRVRFQMPNAPRVASSPLPGGTPHPLAVLPSQQIGPTMPRKRARMPLPPPLMARQLPKVWAAGLARDGSSLRTTLPRYFDGGYGKGSGKSGGKGGKGRGGKGRGLGEDPARGKGGAGKGGAGKGGAGNGKGEGKGKGKGAQTSARIDELCADAASARIGDPAGKNGGRGRGRGRGRGHNGGKGAFFIDRGHSA